ncbi:MAG: hypothetical protein ACP5HU_11705 [Phycisphaerae bacterium]
MTREKPTGPPRVAKRPFWRRWWFIVSVALVLALVGGYLLWDYTAEQALQAEIARIREAGEPIEPADLNRPPIPMEQNAVVALRDAHMALKLTDEQQDLVAHASPALVEKYPQKFRTMVEANTEVLELLREARGRSDAYWGIHFSSPMLELVLPPLGEHRQLARFARAAVLHYHRQGKDDEAMGVIRDMFQQARLVVRTEVLIGSLVSMAIHQLATSSLEDCLSELRIDDPAVRRAVEALIDELLDEKNERESLTRALRAERVFILDTFHCIREGTVGSGLGYSSGLTTVRLKLRSYTPAHKTDCAWGLRQMTAYVEAAKADNYPAAVEKLPNVDAFFLEDSRNRSKYRVSSMLVPALGDAYKRHYEMLAMRRMAATALAMRLYEADHGHRPEKLEDLVPQYLDEIPADPFTADGSPIKLGEWGGRRVLYSVSVNGRDEGGRYAEDPEETLGWESFDIVFFLDGARPYETEDPLAGGSMPTQPAGVEGPGNSGALPQ